jgi:hypothetical protein
VSIFNFKKKLSETAAFNLLWNNAVGLNRPLVKTLKSKLGLSTVEPVFNKPTNFFSITPNVFFTLRHGENLSENASVLSVMLVVIADFFKDARVVSKDLPSFSFLETKLPCSAQAMLDHIKAVAPNQISSLSTMPGEWIVDFGNAVKLTFESLPGTPETVPQNSRLASIEFFYSIPYTGNLSLFI